VKNRSAALVSKLPDLGHFTLERGKVKLGQRPHLKQTSHGEQHRKEIMFLHHVESLPITEIAQRVGLTTRAVRWHITKGREYAKKLTAEVADAMRQMEVRKIYRDDEKACLVWDELQLAADRLGKMLENPSDKVAVVAANALARVGESVAKLREASTAGSAQIAKLCGLFQPTKLIEEQRRLQINLTHSGDGKPTLTWDRSILTEPVRHVEGLTIYEGCRNNGDTTKQLPDTASN
jgi:hypothetical protein